MISLFKKEIYSFFGSVTGYLVICIFVLVTGLFLWVIPGGFNVIDSKQASLSGLFELAPWVYLFLVPAITMRMFAEEKRNGTIELIITRPIQTFQIVASKYLASLLLVAISLLPSILYYYSVSFLGNPVGNIDFGATAGSMIGLFLLASIYIAIGLFASSLTSNQVISFLLAIILSYFFYLGFEYLAFARLPYNLQGFLLQLGINQHYISISRGVIDSRDLFYFGLTTFFFLKFAQRKLSIRTQQFKFRPKAWIIAIVVVVLTIASCSYRLFRLDLTSEKRYSISKVSKEILQHQTNTISIEMYLTGDLPAEMKEFQEAIMEKIDDFNAWSSRRIFYHTFDVYSITSEKDRNDFIEDLTQTGIQPVNFKYKTTEELSTKQIIPGIYIQSNGKGIGIDLLKRNPLLNGDENLKQSIELLEYELIRAIRILQQEQKPKIGFLTGHGEANAYETGDIRYSLSENYNVEELTASQLLDDDTLKIVVVADPKEMFNDKDKLYIDQFIMKGGKVLWCIDPVFCSIDSLSRGYSTIAFGTDLRLTDQFFKYGVRMNPDLLEDVVCAQYPINTAPAGKPTDFTPAPFYFSPLATPSNAHPLSRNLTHVYTEFVSSIEAVGKSEKTKATAILTTSEYAHKLNTPAEVSLAIATAPPARELFNQSNIPIGMLVEGTFESVFQNRMTSSLGIPTNNLIAESKPTKMIFIADGGIIKNKVRMQNERTQLQPLGYDQYSGQTFGNKDFITNCIDYLADDNGILQLRSRVVKLRMLDKVKIREEKLKLQLINTIAPILLIILVGIVFYFYRRRKYS